MSTSLRVDRDTLHVGPVQVTFQRTLRLPDDGRDHPLPPGLGPFPLRLIDGAVHLPIHQREALWLSFGARWWKPNALKVAAGRVNAVSGEPWTETLGAAPQDYVVVPTQPWLDGINSGSGTIRQFVAMPLGMGYTVEGQITGEELHGGLQLCVFEPRPGRFPDAPPRPEFARLARSGGPAEAAAPMAMACAAGPAGAGGVPAMGLGAGGSMRQEIHPDPYGIETWDPSACLRVHVHLCNTAQWRERTGEEPPPTPISARTYAAHGLPWFERWARGDVPPSQKLSRVRTIKEMDAGKGFGSQQDDEPVETGPGIPVPNPWPGWPSGC